MGLLQKIFGTHSENELKRYVEKELRLIKSGKWQEQIHNYIISFSQNGDSLEMWNYYTKGNSIQGYNIGFDIDKLSSCIQIEILDDAGLKRLLDQCGIMHENRIKKSKYTT